MIVGAYDLHLYCDGTDCPNRYEGPACYGGRNRLDAHRQAQRDGWTLYPKKNLAYCHLCKPSGIKSNGRHKGTKQPP